MSDTPYTQIYGLDFTSVMDQEGVSSSGGHRKTNSYSFPDWSKSEIEDEGRDAVEWSGEAHSSSLTDIKQIIKEFNIAPPDCEFYPMNADLCVYAAKASARYAHPMVYQAGTKNYHYGDIKVISREPFAFGPRQGIDFDFDVALPATSATLTNEGTEVNTIDHFRASGGYDATLGRTDDLKLTVNGYELPLCAEMMGHDLFCLSRWGEVRHSYEVNFNHPYTTLQADLGGSTFCTTCSMTDELLTIGAGGASGRVMFPFSGPLPISESPPPTLDFYAESVVNLRVYVAFAGDLDDLTLQSGEIYAGHNIIEIPDTEGYEFVSFGLVGNGVLSSLSATVHRYMDESQLPEIDVGDEFTISVSDGSYSNHLLSSLQASYRDKFWF
jgi:hypothetical protein